MKSFMDQKRRQNTTHFFLYSDSRSSMYDVMYVQYVLANLFKCNAVKVLVSTYTYFFLKLDKRPADCLNFKNESRYSMQYTKISKLYAKNTVLLTLDSLISTVLKHTDTQLKKYTYTQLGYPPFFPIYNMFRVKFRIKNSQLCK